MQCPLEHFDTGLKALWGDVFEAKSIDAFNHWLHGVERDGRRPFQAPVSYWTLLTKVETSCDRILIAGGANVEAEWEQGPAV